MWLRSPDTAQAVDCSAQAACALHLAVLWRCYRYVMRCGEVLANESACSIFFRWGAWRIEHRHCGVAWPAEGLAWCTNAQGGRDAGRE